MGPGARGNNGRDPSRPALDEHFVTIAEDERAGATLHLGFEDSVVAFGDFAHPLGEHRQDRRRNGETHDRIVRPYGASQLGCVRSPSTCCACTATSTSR